MKVLKITLRALLRSSINFYYRIFFKLQYSHKKNNILIYTDSRGFLVNCFLCNKTPYKSYIQKLSKDYNIEYQLCPYKHTTTIDFLNYINNKNVQNYSHIILHLGIVDYSPRPLSQLKMVYNKKLTITNNFLPGVKMLPNYYNNLYQGEKTFSLYDLNFLEYILDRLSKISTETKIIWIGLNKVDLDWNGNYLKQRPSNINIILEYQAYIQKYLLSHSTNIAYININTIKSFELKKHTIDNMHLTNLGFDFLYTEILNELRK